MYSYFNQFKDILDHKTIPKDKPGKKPSKAAAKYKVIYDKTIKGYTVRNSELLFPDNPKKKLAISFPNVVLQMKLISKKNFRIEFNVLNTKEQRKRLIFSPMFKSLQNSFFHTKVPLNEIELEVN